MTNKISTEYLYNELPLLAKVIETEVFIIWIRSKGNIS